MLSFKFKSMELLCRTFPRLLENDRFHRYFNKAFVQYARREWLKTQEVPCV